MMMAGVKAHMVGCIGSWLLGMGFGYKLFRNMILYCQIIHKPSVPFLQVMLGLSMQFLSRVLQQEMLVMKK
jgi:hypothetical protein